MSNLVPNQNTFPTAQEFQTMKELGTMAIKSGFLPTSIKTPEQAVIIMLKGRELGIPPMQAFSSIAVVNGKPTMSAELMLSKIFQSVPGAKVNYISTDQNECVIEAQRPSSKASKFSFNLEDAKRANLLGKGNWQTYPAAMLRARCISAMARAMFPDALSGVVYTPEELGATVDDDGTIISAPEETDQTETATPVAIPSSRKRNPAREVSEAKEAATKNPADYKIEFGKFKGLTIGEVDIYELRDYAEYIVAKAQEENKTIQGKVAEFISHASVVIKERTPEKDFDSGDFEDTAADVAKQAMGT